MNGKRVILAAGILFLFAHVANAQMTLHVNGATGNDSVSRANNSAATPWRTIGRAAWGSTNRSAPNTNEAARAGDTVVVAAGTYNQAASGGYRNNPLYNPVNNGSAGAPITFRAEGRVTLQSTTWSGPVIGSLERNYITWDGFYIDELNVNTAADTGPVVVWASNYTVIQNLEISGKFATYFDNHNGIRLEAARNATIRGNLIYGFGMMRDGVRERHRNAAGIMMYDSNDNVIENNVIHTCGSGVFVKATHLGLGMNNNVIRYNVITDMNESTLSAGSGIILQVSSNTRVYQNVIRDVNYGIEFRVSDGRPVNDIVANNTLYSIHRTAFYLQGTLGTWQNVRVFNNIVRDSGHAIWSEDLPTPGSIAFEHNVYSGMRNAFSSLAYTDRSLSSWRSAFGKDAVAPQSTTVDPGMINAAGLDFRICVAAGQPVGSCSGPSSVAGIGVDILDLDGDGSTTDPMRPGAYITGLEIIGRATNLPRAPVGLTLRTP